MPIPSSASFSGLAIRTGMQDKFDIVRACIPARDSLRLPHLQRGEGLAPHDAFLAQTPDIGGQQFGIRHSAAEADLLRRIAGHPEAGQPSALRPISGLIVKIYG